LTQQPPDPPARWNPGPAFFGWLVPGLGHWVVGQQRRAMIIGLSIALLWILGLLIGGIGVIDHRQHRFWFLGQSLIAPSIGVNYATQKAKTAQLIRTPANDGPIYQPSFSRIHEQGVLFTALAGLLNLLAVIDVACRPQRLNRPART